MGSNNYEQVADSISIDDLNRQLENPLKHFCSLIFQENLAFNSGDMVEGINMSNVFNFQPSYLSQWGNSSWKLRFEPQYSIIKPNIQSSNPMEGLNSSGSDHQKPLSKIKLNK